MAKPKGFFKEGGKTKPRFEKKGITEDSFAKEITRQEDTAAGRIQVMKRELEKERETAKFIHREPVVGYIKTPYYSRRQAVTMHIELKKLDGKKKGIDGKEYENPLELSISDGIWNSTHTDITEGGQGYDTLEEALKKHNFTPNKNISYGEMRKLLSIWKEWHLNGMRAGTRKQEKLIDEHIEDEKYKDLDKFYDRKIAILKDHDLVEDNGIKWGNAWYYEPLPQDVVKFVREVQEKLNVKEDGKPKE